MTIIKKFLAIALMFGCLSVFSPTADASSQKRGKRTARHAKSRKLTRSKKSFSSQLKCPGHGRRRSG